MVHRAGQDMEEIHELADMEEQTEETLEMTEKVGEEDLETEEQGTATVAEADGKMQNLKTSKAVPKIR